MSLSPSLSPLGTTNLFSVSCESVSGLYIHSFVLLFVIVVQLWSSVWHCDPMDCSMPGSPVHHQLLDLSQSHVHQVGDAIQPPHHLSSPSPLPSIFPSIRVFYNESILYIRWPKWSFNFVISPSNEYSGVISFRIDWLDLLVVQGTLKSLLQHHSSKALQCFWAQFFSAQLSLWSNSHIRTSLLEKNHIFEYTDLCW